MNFDIAGGCEGGFAIGGEAKRCVSREAEEERRPRSLKEWH